MLHLDLNMVIFKTLNFHTYDKHICGLSKASFII